MPRSYTSSLLVSESPPNQFSSRVRELSISEAETPPQRRFTSARLIGEYPKPWIHKWKTEKKIRGRTLDSMIFWFGIFLGFALGAVFCWIGYVSVPNFEYCLVFEDNFEHINTENWGYEIQRGGFGTGSFEWTTDDPTNAYTDNEGLHIVPTLTLNTTNITEAELLNGYTLNLTTQGICTSTDPYTACSIYSNHTSGAIINPVRSARLTTQGKQSITYGRVDVVARMPKGDWLWPAIWMMPEESVYGPWPASGEIDLAESKGNDGDTYPSGRDTIISALHWAPIAAVDAFYKTDGKLSVRRTDYSETFNIYGLEWSEKYIFTYVNNRLLQVFFLTFAQGYANMWDRGGFAQDIVNNSALQDPWSQTGRANTPFDQAFYLILNVAIGGTNGYFPDKVGNKPWSNESPTAQLEFWNATDQWSPTWGSPSERGMTVKSVKMFSQGACGT